MTGTAGGEARRPEPDGSGNDRPKAGQEPRRVAAGLTDSAAFCRAVIETIGDHAIFVLAEDATIASWTAVAESMTGYAAEEMIGRAYTDLLADEVDVTATPTTLSVGLERELWWRRRDGSRQRVQERISALRENGAVFGYAVVARDLSAGLEVEEVRRAAQQREDSALERERELRAEVEAAERRSAFLAEASSILVATSLNFESTIRGLARLAVSRLAEWCIVYVLTEDGDVRRMEVAHRDPRREEVLRGLVNTRVQGAPGHPVIDALGNRHSVVFDTMPESFWESVERAGEFSAEARADVDTGRGMVVPLIARGKTLGAVALISSKRGAPYDAEDMELAEELGRRAAFAIDNARLYREAQEANRAKADFLAIMSHELRTPLNAIMGYADLIDAEISGPVTSKQRRQLWRIRASARHLLQLIEEILSFARMESGGEELRLELVTARNLLDEAAAVIEPLAAAKGLQFRIEAEDERTVLETDPGKARQILVNILSNAVKFTPEGEVTVRFRKEGEEGVFEIRDTGVGIARDDMDRIFEPFWQGERPNTRSVGGTGLGLSVSRRFARLLQGNISAESEPGGGTTFTIRLPLRVALALDRARLSGRSGTPTLS